MGGGHGIGIKRNDYRRRNRKRNISTHSHKHGYNKPRKEFTDAEILGKVEVVKMPQAELVKKAKESWAQRRKSDDFQTRNASIQQICFTYVRHHLTNYDELRRPVEKKGLMNSDGYLFILQRVCNAITETYPHLTKECEKFYKERSQKTQKRELKVLKRPETLTQLQLAEYNAREEERWKGILQQFAEEEMQEEVNLTEVLTSLASERTLYFPPFLKPEEIKRRRFESGENNNDRWWEWEVEEGKKSTEGRPKQVKQK